jgi:AcrR family transcriptional regulator
MTGQSGPVKMEQQHAGPTRITSRQRRRTNATRRKLLDAARAVFAEKGMDLARIDEISERADVGKGTLYYHFKGGKAQIIRRLIEDLLSELVEAIGQKCTDTSDISGLLQRLIAVHVEFFSNRWEDFVLYFHGRADLMLEEGYPGIETPFIFYLECIEKLLESAIRYRLPQPMLRRIACAIAGFVSGYYSFAVIAPQDEDIDGVFLSLRGAMVASLIRFIQEAVALNQPAGNRSDQE